MIHFIEYVSHRGGARVSRPKAMLLRLVAAVVYLFVLGLARASEFSVAERRRLREEVRAVLVHLTPDCLLSLRAMNEARRAVLVIIPTAHLAYTALEGCLRRANEQDVPCPVTPGAFD